MRYFHHFLPLHPPVPESELANVQCLHEIPAQTETCEQFMIRLLGRPHTIDIIAVTFPIEFEIGKRGRLIEKVGNHMLAVLRLTYDSHADVLRTGDGFLNLAMESNESVPSYPAAITFQVNENHVADVRNVAALFCETGAKDKAALIALLAEAQTPTIPLHYKILSLVRALEMLFPKEIEREEWLDRYEDRFASVNVSSMRFRNALPAIRARCAHGVSRGGDSPLVGQAYSEIHQLMALLVLLRHVVSEGVQEKLGLQITVNDQLGIL